MSFFIELGNVVARVKGADPAEKAWLEDLLSFTDKSAFFSGKPSRVVLYNQFENSFPAGLLSIVLKKAKAKGLEIQIIDKRTDPLGYTPDIHPSMLPILRDYQVESVEKLIQRKRGILWAATAAGKTQIAGALIKSVPISWVFLVHRKQLLRESSQRISKYIGSECGVIGDGKWKVGEQVTAATIQSLAAAKMTDRGQLLIERTQGIIVDECHVGASASAYNLLNSMKNAYYRFGLSGTPLARSDKKSLYVVAAIGPVVHKVAGKDLIEQGYLSKPTVQFYPVEHPEHPGPWQKTYKDLIVRSKARNSVIVRAVTKAPKPAMVFVKDLTHGRLLAKAFQEQDMKVAFVHGKHTTGARAGAIKRLERGDLDIIVCTSIFQEGVDIPELQTVANARGGSSDIVLIQQIGRAIRRGESKTECSIIEIDDRGHKTLERHTTARLKALAKEGYTTNVLPINNSVLI